LPLLLLLLLLLLPQVLVVSAKAGPRLSPSRALTSSTCSAASSLCCL
jgi:hypothetical protein